MGDETDRARLDRLFETLCDHRRRSVLVHMSAAETDRFTVETIAEAIMEANDDPDAADVRRGRIEADLYHRHLPKLDETGLVEFDPRSRTVRYRGARDEFLETVLEDSELDCVLP